MNGHIDYLEFPSTDIPKTKNFYTHCFEWKFTDYGPNYTSFENSGVKGGFFLSDEPILKGLLCVIYHSDLEKIQDKILKNGGKITKEIFSFPGGKRFHFTDPSGNELAVWSE